MFKAQGLQDEFESKGITYNFGYKGVYPRTNVDVLLL